MTEAAQLEVVGLASDLIRIDTTNTGDPETLAGERRAAEYVATSLSDVGYEVTYLESGAKHRGNVFARLAGRDRSRGALLVHGHLDVVPADRTEWSIDPLSGEVRDEYLWGRGAVDMKGMVAMTVAVARRLRREGVVPQRDLVFAFLADEEAGGAQGARWLAEHRRELFEGVTEAIGEVGGFSVALPGDARAYLIETAEKGPRWLRLRARGTAGHGSMLPADNAVAKLAAAITRLDAHRFPLVISDPVRDFFAAASEIIGIDLLRDGPEAALGHLGPVARMIGATLRDTANVTMFHAGYKMNVVPSLAEATVDCRILPGREEEFGRELTEILGPEIEQEWDELPPVQTRFDGAIVDAMRASIHEEDPGAYLLPYMLSAGTDAKSLHGLGIRTFGFAPMRLPPELDFTALFHGVDERVPVDVLRFGVRVLDRFLRSC